MQKKQIKILEISSYPPPRAGWGMRVYFVKRELEQSGHLCTVLNTGKGRFLTGRDFEPVFSGLDYVKKVFKYRLKGFTVHMHLNGDSPKGFVLTTLALMISLVTFSRPVITFHAGPLQKYFPQSRAPQLNLVYKFIFSAPRHIICNNDLVKNAIAGYGIHPDKIVPIQAFSRQYLQFDEVTLPDAVEEFFQKHPQAICSYVFFRPEFFIEEMIRAVAEVVKTHPQFGLIIMGSEKGSEEIQALIAELGIGEHVLLAGDQDHDAFLTIMSRSKMYLRTPVKDGVCSSVLEALSLQVPVVASENNTRPESVIRYENQNIPDMVEKIKYVLDNHAQVVASIVKPDIRDTIQDEIAVLANEVGTDSFPL
ncbi:MAG TPA: glycosyltransferase [Bacteroidetes bacterium]|nr:glycosyltransferase [Bacteroidota bacterium]